MIERRDRDIRHVTCVPRQYDNEQSINQPDASTVLLFGMLYIVWFIEQNV